VGLAVFPRDTGESHFQPESSAMPQNVFDQGSRYLVGLDAPGFFRWLLGLNEEDVRFRRWLDTRACAEPGERDLTGDKVAYLLNLAEHGVPWALLLEFQIVPDPVMFGRVLRHLGSIWQFTWPDEERGSRFHVAAAIINLTGRGLCSRQLRWPKARLATELSVVERNLEYERAAELLDGVEAGVWPRSLLPFIPLMIGGEDDAIIDKWMALARAEPNNKLRGDYGVITLLFAERVGRRSVWDNKLKEWNVTESAYINEFIALGEARGKAEGEAIGRILTLLEVLQEKFQTVPGDLEAVIRGTTDAKQIRVWLGFAYRATTLEEFRGASGL
jgi:hypothetical protein